MTYCEKCKRLAPVVSNCCGAPTDFVEFKGNTCSKCGEHCLDVCAICGSTDIKVE